MKHQDLATQAGYVFDFEKLDVYQKGLGFVREIFKLSKGLPRDYQFSLGEQFRRAALSIVNNIAEGSGKQSKKEKAQYYRIALSSARECIPMLTLLKEEQLLELKVYNALRQDCIHMCNMLGRLIAVIRQANITQYT